MLLVISGLTNASVTASGTIEGVTATQFGYFKAGQVYVNVHTASVPSGEIRGQVMVGNVAGGALTGAEQRRQVLGEVRLGHRPRPLGDPRHPGGGF